MVCSLYARRILSWDECSGLAGVTSQIWAGLHGCAAGSMVGCTVPSVPVYYQSSSEANALADKAASVVMSPNGAILPVMRIHAHLHLQDSHGNMKATQTT